jgi:hypothetical protein
MESITLIDGSMSANASVYNTYAAKRYDTSLMDDAPTIRSRSDPDSTLIR